MSNNTHSIKSISEELLGEIYRKNCQIPSDINEHLPTIHKYANMSDCVVEFGVRDGVSTSAILASSAKKVFSYDLAYNNTVEKSFEYARLSGKNCSYNFGDSRLVEIDACDLLFIDTEHTYEQLIVELNNHHHKVKNFIVMHDTVTFPELNRAIDEFLYNNTEWQIHKSFHNNNGLTILVRKDQLITVVVPTMWKAQVIFEEQLKLLTECDLISQIIIYDNDTKSTPSWEILKDKKINLTKLGHEDKNYYVNPCWNAGVERSKTDKVCIINDDITFDASVIDIVFNLIQPENGAFGVYADRLTRPMINTGNSISIDQWIGNDHCFGFGQLMFIHKENWKPIIDGLEVYYGDNFIFYHHLSLGLDNYLICGLQWYSPLASTSRSPEITKMSPAEYEIYEKWLKENNIPTTQEEHNVVKHGNKILIAIVCEDVQQVKSRTVSSLMNVDIPDGLLVSIDYVSNTIQQYTDYNYVFVIKDGYVVSENILSKMMSSNEDSIVLDSPTGDHFGCALIKRPAMHRIAELLNANGKNLLNTRHIGEAK